MNVWEVKKVLQHNSKLGVFLKKLCMNKFGKNNTVRDFSDSWLHRTLGPLVDPARRRDTLLPSPCPWELGLGSGEIGGPEDVQLSWKTRSQKNRSFSLLWETGGRSDLSTPQGVPVRHRSRDVSWRRRPVLNHRAKRSGPLTPRLYPPREGLKRSSPPKVGPDLRLEGCLRGGSRVPLCTRTVCL